MPIELNSDPSRQLFRHTVATLAYRGWKALRNAPAGFGEFHAGEALRTPGEILAHLGDLLDWALSMAVGEKKWQASTPTSWDEGCNRFFAALIKLDAFLASGDPIHAPLEKLFQGPVADALTHVGQIAFLRRMAGAPVKGENYYAAAIETGRVGPDQPQPKLEF